VVCPAWDAVAASIARATGKSFKVEQASPGGGGCINRCFHLRGGGCDFFVKVNTPSTLPMFEAEAAGLAEIASTGTVRVPRPVCAERDETQAWLALEYLPLSPGRPRAMALLGERLAAMHRITHARFGWKRDNTIGATPQINRQEPEWTEFWRLHRQGATDTAGRFRTRASDCWNSWRNDSRAIGQPPRCCTAISGEATQR
jgi:fructosamine-3-kinase